MNQCKLRTQNFKLKLEHHDAAAASEPGLTGRLPLLNNSTWQNPFKFQEEFRLRYSNLWGILEALELSDSSK